MAYLVLARKWRPQRFEDVVGQEHVTTTLRNAIAQGRIAHAFLLSGPRGVGKTTVARLLAKALNCAQGPTPEPCGTCSHCTEIAAGGALDVAEIDGASNTGVDNIRDLNESVRYRPASARFKIYIIDEVHMLSTAAFNALLKTLEEPPEHVKFVFATTEVHKLPQTVVSRCQRYEFKRIPTAELVERLRRITADEGIEASEEALFRLAREADGSMRDAQSLLDQVIVFAGKGIGEADVRDALGVADRTLLHQVTEAILTAQPARCLTAVEELHRFGYEVNQFCRDLVRQCRNLTVAALFQDRALIADLPDNEVKETFRQAALRTPEDLQRLFRLAQTGTDEIRRSPLPMLVLEMTLVKMATMPEATPIVELVSRLEELERRLGGPGGAPPAGRGPERSNKAAGPTRSAVPTPASVRPVAGASRPSVEAGPGAERVHAPAAVARKAAVPAASGAAPMASETGAGDAPEREGAASAAWAAVLSASQAKIGLRMCLAGSRLLTETEQEIRVGVGTDFAQRALLQSDNMALLKDMVSAAYGGPRRIEVSVVKPGAEHVAMRMAAEERRRRELSDRAQASPTVRAAIDILGGEVTDVRPRTRGGRDESR